MTASLTALLVLALAAGSWAGVGWLVLNVPPDNLLVIATFYGFAFAGLVATMSFLAWALLRPRTIRGRLGSPALFVGHAMLFAGVALFALWLQSLRMLSPTVAVLLAALYLFLELAFLFGTRGTVDVEVASRVSAAAKW